MKLQKVMTSLVTLAALLVLMVGLGQAQAPDPQCSLAPQTLSSSDAFAAMETAFTYQGQLKKDGQAVSGDCEMVFGLYDDASAGSQLGESITHTVTISDGLFTEALDFGPSAFDGDNRWLAIAVKCSGESAFTPLSRQAITAAPYALYAASTGALQGYPITSTAPLEGEALVWSSGGWTPQTLPGGGGDITAVRAGDGLAGGGETDAVTLTVSFAGNGSAATAARSDHNHDGLYSLDGHTHPGADITSPVAQAVSATFALTATFAGNADLLDGYTAGNAGGNVPVSNGALNANLNADLLDGQHGADYQSRVSGACSVGSTVRAINAGGSVVCQVDAPLNRPAPPAANGISPLWGAGDVGGHSSVTIGADGLGLISYYDSANGDLKVAHCGNAACTAYTFTTLDSTGNVGQYTSVAIGADGLGLISYYDIGNGDLKVAHCSDAACTAATRTTLDGDGDVGSYTSVIIGADGRGLISYYDVTNSALKVAHCSNVACTTATLTTLDNTGDVGQYTSAVIGADGLGLISYYDGTNSELKVAHCSDVACTAATLTTLSYGPFEIVGQYSSVTIGADGLGLISYYDISSQALTVAHCSNAACTAAGIITLDVSGGGHTSVTIGADGLGLISYYDYTNSALKVAHCRDVACTAATIATLDSDGDVGRYTSVTIGADGLGLISYLDDTNGDLKVAHCSNAFCAPYFRRR